MPILLVTLEHHSYESQYWYPISVFNTLLPMLSFHYCSSFHLFLFSLYLEFSTHIFNTIRPSLLPLTPFLLLVTFSVTMTVAYYHFYIHIGNGGSSQYGSATFATSVRGHCSGSRFGVTVWGHCLRSQVCLFGSVLIEVWSKWLQIQNESIPSWILTRGKGRNTKPNTSK